MLDDPMEVDGSVVADALRLLETWIIEEERLVTFGMLAAELSVNVNLAKRLLYTFAQSERKRRQETSGAVDAADRREVACLYCVSGWTSKEGTQAASASSARHGVDNGRPACQIMRIVSEDALEETKAQLDKVTGVHVYALTPGPAKKDVANSIAASVVAHQREQSTKTAARPFAEKADNIVRDKHEERKPASQPSSVSSSMSSSVQSRPSTSSTSKTSSMSKTSAPAKPASHDPRRGFFAGHANKPQAKSSGQTTTTAKSSKTAKTASAGEDATAQKSRKRRIINEASDDDDDFVAPTEERPKASIPVEDLFDTEMADPPAASPATPASNDDATATESSAMDATPSEASMPAKDERPRKRGRRRVTRRKTFKNERGYMVTEEVEDWESYSEDDSTDQQTGTGTRAASQSAAGRSDAAKTNAAATTRTASTAGASGQQRSLLSFFKK
ncbi:DNA polymerase subunit Cdc27 [Syncephalis pseudoplumigaleata]|uniref:DNA polymerase delta subunit 3 n=1 Tax=Syncephalis pseudoplumigaleata TaxID=1712513 RepID=A0A4P9Z1A6_9FUNG|nr:DNA polymerase subunit Cdc27 [Syncephalis pseudoplumigaleata]|eukprot:RKP26273.1 DNA polymerase subunit Cdc27 [Syncephalis pseudoplumigaleata]